MQKQIVRRQPVDDSFLPDSINPVIKQIYAARQVSSVDELDTGVKALHRDTMSGLTQASTLLADALQYQKRVVIVGDFDADGATSSALMVLGLRMFGFQQVKFLVPNRFDFGYGLSPEMANLVISEGADLLITVDNGISCVEGVNVAKQAGIKVIITDHHLPGDRTPDADAIVNPNQHGCEFPSKNLAGVGVAFYLMLSFRRFLREQGWFEQQGIQPPNVAELLDLVALGTVADVVALDANNRILVHQGLQRIRSGNCRPGIKALVEVSGRSLHKLVASDLGFALGPRINAAGRLDDMTLGINCLITDDINLARQIASELDQLNVTRREIESDMQAEAEYIIRNLHVESNIPNAFCLYQEDWHQGVIGILAGRIKDKYHRPVIAFAKADEALTGSELKGSARSISGLHIRDILEEIDTANPGVIKKFGGHAMAAGLSVELSQFERFKVLFDEVVTRHITEEQKTSQILSDGELDSDALSLSFAQLVRDSGPWGQAFPEPVFDGHFVIVQQRLVGGKHLKMVLQHETGHLVDAIWFNIDVNRWPDPMIRHVHVAYQIDVNEFRDQFSVQLMVREVIPE